MAKRSAKRSAARRRSTAASAPQAEPFDGLALARVLDRETELALALALVATVPVFWRLAAGRLPALVAVGALAVLAAGAVLLDRRQWNRRQQRQMLLTLLCVALSGALAFGSPFAALPVAAVAAVLAFRSGDGGASALVLGAGVAISLIRLEPSVGYVLILGATWPAIGATLMRRIVSVQSGRDRYA